MKKIPWEILLCGLVGFTTPFTVFWLGNFPVAEWLLAGAAVWVLIARVLLHRWPPGAFQTRWFIVFVVCQILSLLAYIMSDYYRGSAPHDYIRGWARMTFLIIDLLGLAALVGNVWQRWFALKIGLALGVMAEAMCFGPLFGNWWKFGFGMPVTILILAALGNHRKWAAVFLLLLTVAHLLLGFRGLAVVCLLLAASLCTPSISLRWRVPAIGVLLVAAASFLGFYLTGSTEMIKSSDNERQAMMETAAAAFVESPFIGQGSWFSTTHIINKIEARRMSLEEGFAGYDEESADKLAIHSQILVSVAEGGIMGGTFFIVLGLFLLWAAFYGITNDGPQRPLMLLFIFEAFGNLWISPFSGPARVHIAAAALLVLLLWQEKRGRLAWQEEYK